MNNINKKNTCNHWIVKPFSKKTHVHSFFALYNYIIAYDSSYDVFTTAYAIDIAFGFDPKTISLCFTTNASTFTKLHKIIDTSFHSQKMCNYVTHLAKTTIY
jgi:hypothetical protein